MRKLMALAAICLPLTLNQSWAALGMGDVSFDGSLEVSGNSANNEVDFGNDPDVGSIRGTGSSNDHRGRTASRVRLGMSSQVTEGVNGRIELIRDTRQYGTGVTSVSTEEGLWNFHNAYVDILDLWGASFRLGRQFVGNPGDLVWNISPTDDDNLTNRSIDGLLVGYNKLQFLNIALFTGKADNSVTNGEDDTITGGVADTDQGDVSGDVNLSSLDLVFPTLVPGGKINVGYLWGVDSNTNASGDDNRLQMARVGVKGGVAENMLTYRAEFFQNMGQFDGQGLTGPAPGTATDLDYEGNAIDLGVGFNSKESSIGTFGVWLNWLMSSGDDNTADDKDESFHDFSVLGFNTSDRLLGEIFGKSNVLGNGTPLGQGLDSTNSGGVEGQGLEVINLGAHFKPGFSTKSTFRLDYFMFSRAEDSVVSTIGGSAANVGDDFGTEIDLAWMYDHSANVGVELGYAMLSPDDALTGVPAAGAPGFQDEDVTKFFARTKIKWGGEAQ